MSKKNIYKPKPISGFPEWLPEWRAVEQQWLDKIRAVFERYGYCSIETPAVEELEVIAAKGEDVDKEIYVLERLHKQEGDKDARLALHFDQTVPLSRYVAQNFNELTFPFKRYQMQKVWRGERPQMGRMREFYQCDIDVINVDNLPIHFDAEVASICYEALASLDIGRVQLRISNRKILLGLMEALEIEDPVPVTRFIDKLEKLGREEIEPLLTKEVGLSDTQTAEIIALAGTTDLSNIEAQNDMMREGLEELSFVMDNLKHLGDGARADLSIVRGLDYYTGTVYETQLLDVPEFTGSVCSGGRYDDLAGSYINKHLPGVGISIGFSRLFDVLKQSGKIEAGAKSPALVLMALPEEETRAAASETARTLRDKGINVEQYHAPQKIGKQIAYAEKKGIRYVWFPFADGHKVKDLESGDQVDADAKAWEA
ncbi:MAG: histidine--tRNA ligase [Pseudomonadota bacterium]